MNNTYPQENIFGKMRGRYDEVMARRVVAPLVDRALNMIWSLSDDDLAELVRRHNERNKSGSHRLRMELKHEVGR